MSTTFFEKLKNCGVKVFHRIFTTLLLYCTKVLYHFSVLKYEFFMFFLKAYLTSKVNTFHEIYITISSKKHNEFFVNPLDSKYRPSVE